MTSQKRITKEYADLIKTPPEGMEIGLFNESDIYKWKIIMDGPSGSPYSGGKFTVLLTLPSEYPFKPPTISFQTKIYHPNVSNDDKGSMCIGMLKTDEWKPSSRISAALLAARNLLVEPNPDDPVEGSIADLLRNNRKEFEKTAKDWTKKYAH